MAKEKPTTTDSAKPDDPDKMPKALDIPVRDNQIAHWFKHHKLDEEAQLNVDRVRLAGGGLASVIKSATRNCPDQQKAIQCVREAVFYANAAIACKGK